MLNQTFKEFELWVLENGSEDGTAQVVRSIKDSRIRLFELGPIGVQGALQYAIGNAPTEWLARMDADDLMFPNRLELQMNFIRQNPNWVFIGTAYAFLTPFGHILELLSGGAREVTKRELAGRRSFPDSSIVFNRHAALGAGGVDAEFTKCDGLPLMFRLLSQGKAWRMAEHLQLYRLRPKSLSRSEDHDEESRRIHVKYAPEFFEARSDKLPPQSFWRLIAKLELLTGDTTMVRSAIVEMKREGLFESQAKSMHLRSLLGRPGGVYYRWRYRDLYRHRPDWEKLFSPLLQDSACFAAT